MADFHPARLLERAAAGGGMTRMVLEVPAALAAAYTSPGQYVEVRISGETGFFVLSNQPGTRSWEVVMRPGGGASEVLLDSPVGVTFDVTPPIGAGFAMDDMRSTSLLLVLGGTGVAAGPPLVERRIRDGDASRTRIYLGVRTADELPMRADLVKWMRGGAHLLVCCSQGRDEGPHDGIPFAPGYVQDVLRRESDLHRWSGEPVFAVGPVAMIQALRNLARVLGVAPERVLTNY